MDLLACIDQTSRPEPYSKVAKSDLLDKLCCFLKLAASKPEDRTLRTRATKICDAITLKNESAVKAMAINSLKAVELLRGQASGEHSSLAVSMGIKATHQDLDDIATRLQFSTANLRSTFASLNVENWEEVVSPFLNLPSLQKVDEGIESSVAIAHSVIGFSSQLAALMAARKDQLDTNLIPSDSYFRPIPLHGPFAVRQFKWSRLFLCFVRVQGLLQGRENVFALRVRSDFLGYIL